LPVDVTFVNLLVTLRLEAECRDSSALFAVRGDFEEALRRAAGCRCDDRVSSPSAAVCAFHHAFGRALTPDPAALKRFQKPSAPFVFTLPLLPAAPNRGREVTLGLTLTGTAANHVVVYLEAVRQLFGTGRGPGLPSATVVRVESRGYGESRHLIREGEGGVRLDLLEQLSLNGLLSGLPLVPREMTLSLETPLRLLHEGRPVRELSFSAFLRPLMRRVSSLAYYYGETEMDLDFRWLATRSETVASEASVRWVGRGGESAGAPSGGLVGAITFRGDLADFLPFLLLGEFVHLGKGASFGLGAYRIARMA
jgi:CRISPR-associated endoribonuclease Cas6